MDANLHRRALSLSYFTVGYNILEGLVSIFAGAAAGSIALIGFGLDSFVESISGGVMIWRFRQIGRISEAEEERVERRAARFVAYSFFILGAYVLYESAKKLYFQEAANPSTLGIIVAVASIIVMPVLFYMKYKTGRALQSPGEVIITVLDGAQFVDHLPEAHLSVSHDDLAVLFQPDFVFDLHVGLLRFRYAFISRSRSSVNGNLSKVYRFLFISR